MFNNQKKAYTIYKSKKAMDEYNQEKIEWEEIGTENIFIGLNTHVQITSNALYAQQCEWIGVTNLPSIVEVGHKVGEYEVIFIVDAGRDRFLYLR